MAEEKLPDFLTGLGHVFDPTPFAVDVYRLVCLVLADKAVAKLDRRRLTTLKDQYVRPEVTRILISTAVALRIRFDPKDPFHKKLEKSKCGKLYPRLRSRKPEVLTLREACNKIIHATQIRFHIHTPSPRYKGDEEDAYISRPLLYLYGNKDGADWRAVLSMIDFAALSAAFFERH
jgi:hypothetical protein